MKLYFDHPARDHYESIPVGNGRLGAGIYGELLREQLVLNESSMWSGSPEESDREDAGEYLDPIRELLHDGKNYEAERLYAGHFTCKGAGSNYAHGAEAPFGCYETLGILRFSWFQATSFSSQDMCGAKNYRRFLDLGDGIVRVEFDLGGKHYQRLYIALREPDVLAIVFRCSEPGQISFSAGLDRDEEFQLEGHTRGGRHSLLMHGDLSDGKGGKGLHYACGISAAAEGGTICRTDNRLYVRGADEAVVYVDAQTNMRGFLGAHAEDPDSAVLESLDRAASLDIRDAEECYKKEYTKRFGTLELTLADWEMNSENRENISVEKRLADVISGVSDPGFFVLYMQYGRYMLWSSCRGGGLPANLQGIWADEIQTPWNGDWHLNAQQEIFWLAERGGLSDSHLPFLELTERLAGPGRHTAQCYYHANGWTVHTMTNPWGFTSPLENAAWGSTLGSAAWQCHHLFEHFLYTGDREYLHRVWPVMRGAAEFYLDMLVPSSRTGKLVTSPSSSPENVFFDEEGRECALCEGPTYDKELVKQLFLYCLDAQKLLRNDKEFEIKLKNILPALADIEIGPDGRIMEWDRNYEEALPYHRHISHLWGVYPGSLITRERTPALAAAALKSLDQRSMTTAGWANAFRACVSARLRSGSRTYHYVMEMFRYATMHNLFNISWHCDERKQNPELPDNEHERSNFQIDGNEAGAAAILMMFFDDEADIDDDGNIHTKIFLLPALPEKFPEGHLRGVHARGGFEVEFSWKESRVTEYCIRGGYENSSYEVIWQ